MAHLPLWKSKASPSRVRKDQRHWLCVDGRKDLTPAHTSSRDTCFMSQVTAVSRLAYANKGSCWTWGL